MLTNRLAVGVALSVVFIVVATGAIAFDVPQPLNLPAGSGGHPSDHGGHKKKKAGKPAPAPGSATAASGASTAPAGGGTPGSPAPAAQAALLSRPPPAPPVNPLLTRLRGEAPQHKAESVLAVGQVWGVQVQSSNGPNCNGSIRIQTADTTEAFSGPAVFSCMGPAAPFSFQQDASFVDDGEEVIVTLGHTTGDAQAPHWPTLHLSRAAPTRMTGASTDPDASAAFTFVLQSN